MTTSPETTGPLVRIRDLHKFFGSFEALRGIDLDIATGEKVALLGASGSGKSTLCRCINRLETIASGTIHIDGQELPAEGKKLAQLRAEVGMVFQSFNLFPNYTALENITLAPVHVRHQPKAAARAEAVQLLERV
ncbi:MAG: ATP-binding cassette domain-containing protein, partial [Propionibacterium sp.]